MEDLDNLTRFDVSTSSDNFCCFGTVEFCSIFCVRMQSIDIPNLQLKGCEVLGSTAFREVNSMKEESQFIRIE